VSGNLLHKELGFALPKKLLFAMLVTTLVTAPLCNKNPKCYNKTTNRKESADNKSSCSKRGAGEARIRIELEQRQQRKKIGPDERQTLALRYLHVVISGCMVQLGY